MAIFQSFSEAGRKGENQDTVLICRSSNKALLVAIADGMGGKEAGDKASQVAISSIKDEFENSTKLDLSLAFQKAKDNICAFAEAHGIKQMGTTMTACLIEGRKALVAHVGDTRLYHLRNNGIITITQDQTEVQKLIDDGILSKKRALKYHRKNILLSAISNYTEYSLFLKEFDTKIGDRLVLISDGAYELVQKIEIRDISINQNDLTSFVENIKSIIQTRKIRDDYSLVACEIT